MSARELVIEGARQNNLKNVSLSVPHNSVIAITGVSGSGKSSLAFDTIFAEGQWRFIESLSTYARLFLEKLDRPDVDAILNIRPAIALEQKNPVRGSRSTVGTLTELYDFFRMLYAKIALPICPSCGSDVRRWDPSQIVSWLIGQHAGKRALVVFESGMEPSELKKLGFRRVLIAGKIIDIDELQEVQESSHAAPPVKREVVLDRFLIKDGLHLADSIEAAWREGKSRLNVIIFEEDGRSARFGFSSENLCDFCGLKLPEAAPILFSFNHPVGACPECKGFGNTLSYDEDLIIPDKSLSLAQGAIAPWNKPACRWWRKQLKDKGKSAGLDLEKPYMDFSKRETEILFKGAGKFYGIDDFFEDMEGRRYKLHVRVFLSRYRRAVTCPVCRGKRLTKEALAYRISGYDIADLCSKPISELSRLLTGLDISPFMKDVSQEIMRQITMKLRFLEQVGLEYLTLNRYGKTLSGGEYQRINISNQLSSLLTGTIYVLDEPTVGLHPRDTERVSKIMRQLSELGNTVIVVEHDKSVIESSDWIVELGPGGGHKGGEVVFSGPARNFVSSNTLTARYLTGKEKIRLLTRDIRLRIEKIVLRGAKGNNLKNVDLSMPLGRLVAVTGVSGSGKSSLIVETLYRALTDKFSQAMEPPLSFAALEGQEKIKGARLIDQSPIGKSPRSNPVTYLKIFDHVRKLFADQRESRAHGYGPGFFSFNVKGGRCETCKGEGYELMEMYFFENLYVRCEKCDGKRYSPEALRIKYRGKDISEVLDMTVEEALQVFGDHPAISSRLELLTETGLGYLRLGQPATTLSGGEAQRLKICAELGTAPKKDYLYILDEPTVGLHFADVQALLNILNRLVESGNSVIVIEHNLDVIRSADWIVDLGPGGGDKGGAIIFEGKPVDIVKEEHSYTGRYLRNYF